MDEQLSQYVLLDVVGAGPRGTVHRARPTDRPGRIVAIRQLHRSAPDGAVARVRREAAVLTSLGHPAILSPFDVFDDGAGGVSLVLPYAPGGSLEELLSRTTRLPWPQVADLGARLASALSAAHGAGILHRDVRPANVLLGAEAEPHLAGFGVVVLCDDLLDDSLVGGTAEYVDPAVAVDGTAPSPGSDLYGLGVLLYRALSGQLPYAGSTPSGTLAAADRGVHAPLGALTDAPEEVVAAIECAMARRPEDRFATARQLRSVLEAVAHEAEPAGGRDLAAGWPDGVPDPAPPGADAGSRSASWWAVAALIVVVSLLVLAGPWSRARGGGVPDPPTTGALARRAPGWCHGVDPPVGGVQVLQADVDGRGCSLPLVLTDEQVEGEATVVLAVPDAADDLAGRYAVAAGDDQVVVGDWDCDGTDTPGVYRPTDGTVHLYSGYGALDSQAGTGLVPHGRAVVVTTPGGCDELVLDTPTGVRDE